MHQPAPFQHALDDAARQDERTRIARELHDDLGGNLIAIKMALARLSARLPADQSGLAGQAQYIDDLVERTIESVERISLGLRAAPLDLGLVAALAWLAREFTRQTGVAVTTHCPDTPAPAPAHADALFHIAQEALTNVAKHARATQVTLTLEREGGELTLSICDNGCGIDPAARTRPHAFGLRGMHERASALGGVLSLSAAPGGGTMLTVKIRLAPPVAPAQNKKQNE
ncbi:signal transduction histidine kinase [Massilia sp. MP_M2]|uniref:sensor histidine kinase n=1 Tax=Massilia sp. MP_M2 TaxID=3071713 RepID=UPI00319E2BFB